MRASPESPIDFDKASDFTRITLSFIQTFFGIHFGEETLNAYYIGLAPGELEALTGRFSRFPG